MLENKFSNEPLPEENIKKLLKDMQSDIGTEGVMLADGSDLDVDVRGVVSTQCIALDRAIGKGGVPLGRLTIIHGSEGCGKTTAALHIASEVQKIGGIAIYLDKEYKLDLEYGENLGVDRKRLFLYQPHTLESAFEYIETAIKHTAKLREKLKKRVPVVVILDSMNAAISKSQFNGDWDDQHYAPQARVFSQNLPKLMPLVYKEDIALVWISQIRQKLNVMFGNDEEIAGGKSPRFYASLIMSMKTSGKIKKTIDKKEKIIGNKVNVIIQKNQIAVPFKKAEIMIRYGYGIDNEYSILNTAIDLEIIEKSGKKLDYGEKSLGNLEKACETLRKDTELREKILKDIENANSGR
jgi:recombination protein RecA